MRYRIVQRVTGAWQDVDADGCTDLTRAEAVESILYFYELDSDESPLEFGICPMDATVWKHTKSPYQWGYHNEDVELIP